MGLTGNEYKILVTVCFHGFAWVLPGSQGFSWDLMGLRHFPDGRSWSITGFHGRPLGKLSNVLENSPVC